MTNPADVFNLSLRLADDALVLGHRLSEWCGHAPMLEEDIALANLGLDLIGQARAFYTYAGQIEGRGRDEDKLAYFRNVFDFQNVLLVEQPNGDFAATIARQFLYAAFAHPYFQALQQSSDKTLSEIAAKAVKEMAYHVRHSSEWMIRLGDGTDESRRRVVAALDELWSYSGELFESDPSEQVLVKAGVAPDRALLKPQWDVKIAQVLKQATLDLPTPRAMQSGGRRGIHSEHLGHLLATMQVLAREHPDAVW
jgi:ring-1,2-phenylacetyl-CoA epoxidase subunit PaaC